MYSHTGDFGIEKMHIPATNAMRRGKNEINGAAGKEQTNEKKNYLPIAPQCDTHSRDGPQREKKGIRKKGQIRWSRQIKLKQAGKQTKKRLQTHTLAQTGQLYRNLCQQ